MKSSNAVNVILPSVMCIAPATATSFASCIFPSLWHPINRRSRTRPRSGSHAISCHQSKARASANSGYIALIQRIRL
jgi:hypothetical protein